MLCLHPKCFLFLTENLVKVTKTFTNRERVIFGDIFISGEQNSSPEFAFEQASSVRLERRGTRVTMIPPSLNTNWVVTLPSEHICVWVSQISDIRTLPFCGTWLEFCECFLLHMGCSYNIDKVNMYHPKISFQISTEELSSDFSISHLSCSLRFFTVVLTLTKQGAAPCWTSYHSISNHCLWHVSMLQIPWW